VVQRREKKKERGPLDYQTPQASTVKANRAAPSSAAAQRSSLGAAEGGTGGGFSSAAVCRG
jgi:hypothetical protein